MLQGTSNCDQYSLPGRLQTAETACAPDSFESSEPFWHYKLLIVWSRCRLRAMHALFWCGQYAQVLCIRIPTDSVMLSFNASVRH
jgi:hypothetical protein